MKHFKVERIVPNDNNTGGLRFTAPDGWVDLEILGDGRASLWTGTYNATPPEAFANRLWQLLRDVVPELGLQVVSAEVPGNDPNCEFLETLLVWAGFQLEGRRRQWHPDESNHLHDVALYSLLASEVRYEATTPAATAGASEETNNGLLPA